MNLFQRFLFIYVFAALGFVLFFQWAQNISDRGIKRAVPEQANTTSVTAEVETITGFLSESQENITAHQVSSTIPVTLPTTRSPRKLTVPVNPTIPLLTLVTSFPEFSARSAVWNRTLRNWAQLGKWIKPVVYVQNDTEAWTDLAHGWTVRNVPETIADLPVLRHMMIDAQNISQSTFYGYANGDLLFDSTLLETLRCVLGKYEYLDGKLLMVGRRTNVNTTILADDVLATLHDSKTVHQLASKTPKFNIHAQDYFISFKDGFPWEDIPDFVIGRVAYDNWLVIQANRWGYNVVDASRTLHALHQTDEISNFVSHDKANKSINFELAKVNETSFDFSYGGYTSCAKYATTSKKPMNHVILMKRKPPRTLCSPSTKRADSEANIKVLILVVSILSIFITLVSICVCVVANDSLVYENDYTVYR